MGKLPAKLKKPAKYFAGFAIVIVAILITTLYSSNRFLDYAIMQTNNRFDVHKNTSKLKWRNIFLNMYPTSFFAQPGQEYRKMVIDFPHLSVEELEKQVELAEAAGISRSEHKNYVPGYLLFGQYQYSVQVKLHGTTSGNFIGLKKSWSIKTEHGNFNLITPKQHHYLVPLYANYFAKKLGLYYNEQKLVVVNSSMSGDGLYWKEEKINDDFLKNRKLVNAVIVAINNNWVEAIRNGKWELVCQPANIKRQKEPDMHEAINAYSRLLAAIEINNADSVLHFFDDNYLANFEAYRNLLGVCHDIIGDNLRMIYKNKTGKFYPVVRSEGDLTMLAVIEGSTWKSYNNYSDEAVKKHHYMRLFNLLNTNKEFVALKQRALKKVLNNKHEILKELDNIHQKHLNAVCYDRNDYHSIREKKVLLPELFGYINHNFSAIEATIEKE